MDASDAVSSTAGGPPGFALARSAICWKPMLRMPDIDVDRINLGFAFLVLVLFQSVAADEEGEDGASLAPTAAPNAPAEQGNNGALIGAIIGGVGFVLLCAAGCFGQYKEFFYELRMRR